MRRGRSRALQADGTASVKSLRVKKAGESWCVKHSIISFYPGLSSGCCNKVPQTGCLNKQQKFIFRFWTLGSSRLRCWIIQCLVTPHFLAHDNCLFAVFSRGGWFQRALCGLFNKDTNPIHEGSALMTCSPSKDPTSNTTTLGIRFQLMNRGG